MEGMTFIQAVMMLSSLGSATPESKPQAVLANKGSPWESEVPKEGFYETILNVLNFGL